MRRPMSTWLDLKVWDAWLVTCLSVDCSPPFAVSPPALLGRCPPVKGPGVCAELCVNCAARGMVCCSNGCGHQCMKPVSPVSPRE